MTDTSNMTPEQIAALAAQQEQNATGATPPTPAVVGAAYVTPPVTNENVAPGAEQFTPEVIAANAPPATQDAVQASTPETQQNQETTEHAPTVDGVSYLEQVGLTLDEMQIAMHSDTEIHFTNGKTIPIVGFVDAAGNRVDNIAHAKCILAGDGSVSIPLPY